ncbi:DUF896 domain-containing protein [Thermosinus carboxydivorans]|nr:DUF896 domain-containing protein [Thermosinus carboxydivorans]
MITPEMIARINELARKQRSCGLSEQEKTEQAILRRQYIDHIKAQVREQLGSSQNPAVQPRPRLPLRLSSPPLIAGYSLSPKGVRAWEIFPTAKAPIMWRF